jgi:hypothetical protein
MKYLMSVAMLLMAQVAAASCSDDGKALWQTYAAQNPTTRTEYQITLAQADMLICYRRTFLLTRAPFKVLRGSFGLPPKPGAFLLVTHGKAPYPGGPT